MSVQDILMQMAQNAGRAQLQRGALLGTAISSAALVPGQILNDRENQAILDAQKQRLANQDARGAAQDARQAAKDAQDQAAAQAAKDHEQIVNAGLVAAIGPGGDPSNFDAKAAFDAVSKAGHPEAIRDVIARHREIVTKPVEFDPTHGSMNPDTGQVLRPPQEKMPEIGTPGYEVAVRRQALMQPPTSGVLPGAMVAPPPLGAPAPPAPPVAGMSPTDATLKAYEDQRKATTKPPAPPEVGTFADYVTRKAAEIGKPTNLLTPKDIEGFRKSYGDSGRVTVVTPGQGDDVKLAVQAMKEGTAPPLLPGRASKEYLATIAEAKRQGYDLASAAQDWTATQKHIATMNGAQQLRLNQAVNSLPDMLDSVDTLASQWKGGKFPILNKANLALAKGGAYGSAVASVANQLDAQIADVTADLGNVYMGGNSPTDHALGLAGKSLSGDWDEKVLHDMVKLAKKNVTIRQNSIKNTGVAGASENNPYAPKPAAAAPGQPIKVGGFTVVVK